MKRKQLTVAVTTGLLAMPVAQASAANTFRLVVRERELPKTFQRHDVDRSGSDTVGDFFKGDIALIKKGKRVGLVHFKSTITAIDGSVITAHVVFSVRLKGGHIFGFTDETQDQRVVPKVGDKEVLTVNRGDGKFKGYTGTVTSRVFSLSKTCQARFLDTILLRN